MIASAFPYHDIIYAYVCWQRLGTERGFFKGGTGFVQESRKCFD